jgi:hypothetical protein
MAAILVFADTIHTDFASMRTHILISRSLLNQYYTLIIINDLNLYLPGLNNQSNLSQPQHSFAHHSWPIWFQVCSNLQNKLYMNCSFKVIRSKSALDISDKIYVDWYTNLWITIMYQFLKGQLFLNLQLFYSEFARKFWLSLYIQWNYVTFTVYNFKLEASSWSIYN